MRILTVALPFAALLAASPALASPALAESGRIPLSGAPATPAADAPLIVARGQQLGIACSCTSRNAADVRVVLDLDKSANEAPTGYRKVLATDQHVGLGALMVTVPDTPGLANHTVRVRVYVVGAKGARSCDAGMLKIT